MSLEGFGSGLETGTGVQLGEFDPLYQLQNHCQKRRNDVRSLIVRRGAPRAR